MRFLLDEALPVQLLEPLRITNRGHQFEHVDDLLWKGKRDVNLFADAAAQGFDGIITVNVSQLVNRDEWRALRRADLHHISIKQRRANRGLRDVARVMASIIVATPYVLADLEEATKQQIVDIKLLDARARHAANRADRMKTP